MAESLSPEAQIVALRRELAQRDAIIAAHEAERAEAAIVKARLTAALLEIEQIKMQLATLRRQRYGQTVGDDDSGMDLQEALALRVDSATEQD